ncbi:MULTISPECIES: hypothetical protein [Pseudanabaena]|uniref:hypothetical protein n=1 Tax=Pseudanabaena TaxID=1152 RepID=UPI002479A3C6|nr:MULTISPECIES: hypothetical protein [Pseudanabaena]MEA5487004.1 hypothetical protein [Pseudanabaena sp. CCNP1317]WGS71789.1 hypothetical protein OA858_19110 [Pseudanabaena galeata CCNP1313]
MALKIGRLEIGYRLLISLTAIAIAYGWIGTQLCTLLRVGDYLVGGLLFVLSVVAIFAIPQSLGGLLAAIAAVITVYWQSSDITYSLITAGVCLGLYLIGFQDVRYDTAPEKKLSIIEIIATSITIGFMVQTSLLVLLIPISWVTSAAIGAIAAAITLIGRQLAYIDLSQKMIWQLFGGVTISSLAIGFVIRAILYATTREVNLL